MQHPIHIGEDRVPVLLHGRLVALFPELAVAFSDGRNEVVFLHVARRERAVEVVDQRYGQFFRHWIAFLFCSKDTKKTRKKAGAAGSARTSWVSVPASAEIGSMREETAWLRATLHAAGPDRCGRRFGPMWSAVRSTGSPAAISAPEPCRSGGACGIGDSVAFFRGTCCNDFPHGLRSVENLSKGGSPGVRRLAAGISTGMRVVGVTVGFRVSADGYRSGFSGARLLEAGLHVFMSGTDIFRFEHSGRERGPLASFSRRQIFRPRLHKPGEPP